MKTLVLLGISTTLAMGFAGCSKSTTDEAACPGCDCPSLPILPPGTGPHQTGASLAYTYPSFNPKNSRELVYYKESVNSAASGLYTANLDTRQERLIWAGTGIFLQVHWSSTGWLAFSRYGQVWKLKATGDSLTQLTFGGQHYQPQWSPDGQRLVCQETDSPGAPLVVLDKNGRRLRQLSGYPTQYCQGWSPDGTKLLVAYGDYGQGGYGLGVYDLASNQVTLVAVSEVVGSSFGLLNGAVWLPDSRNAIWCSGKGVFTTDTNTGTTRQLHPGCETRVYLTPDLSADGRTLVVRRVDNKSVENDTGVYSESNLWLMNVDGSNERKLTF